MKKLVLAALLASFTFGASAAEKINFGVSATYPPFESIGANNEIVGFDIDLAKALCKQMQAECTFTNHAFDSLIPSLKFRKYDAVISGMDITPERSKQVSFTTPYYENSAVVIAKKDTYKTFADLKGKAVVVTSGTTSEVLLNKLNEEQKMNMRIISAKDHGDSFRTLESGRAVAFMMDDALLAGERAKAKKPDNWDIVGKPQSQEAYGCMLRKDDPQFKKLMDDTIAQVQTSGEAEKWFDKWFKNPIPPKNLNMNFELSDEMKALFKEPNDKALN